MGRVATIDHNGTSILFLDFSKISTAETPAVIQEAISVIRSSPPSSLRIMSDFTDANYDKQTTADVKAFSAGNKPYVKASAVVGITGLKKIIFTGIISATGRKMNLCNTREEAKDWLITQ